MSSLGGESAELVSRYGAGARYAPSDAESCAKAIREVADGLLDFRRRSRRMAEAEFDSDRIYREYVAVVSRIKT